MVHSNDPRADFAARLKEALEHAGLSGRGEGARLAKIAGVTPKAASKWLNGESRPSHDKLCAIARHLAVREEWLEYGRGQMVLFVREPGPDYGRTARAVQDLRPATQKPEEGFEWIQHEIVEGDEPLRPDEVWLPIYREVEFSAGNGATQVIENHGARERFSLPRLARQHVQPENAALAVAKGDSMTPAINDGATIGIDKGCRTIVDGKIYALDHDGMLRVKRLYRLPPGRMRVVSENADEYPEEVYGINDPDAPRILGRVFWWENFD